MDRIWPGYTPGWPGNAPGWPSYAPLMGITCGPLSKTPEIFEKYKFLNFFHQGAQIGCKSRKTGFYVFCLFTPLYGRFRLSRASQTIDIEKIYRLVSKILNFMPCGLVLDLFCVQSKNFVASASKFYRNSIEILSKSYAKTRKWFNTEPGGMKWRIFDTNR